MQRLKTPLQQHKYNKPGFSTILARSSKRGSAALLFQIQLETVRMSAKKLIFVGVEIEHFLGLDSPVGCNHDRPYHLLCKACLFPIVIVIQLPAQTSSTWESTCSKKWDSQTCPVLV